MSVAPDASQRLDDPAFGAVLAGGQRVLGRYVLDVELGRGGMGVVWRARDETLGETVALKFLPDYVARDAVAVDELKQETRRAHRLTHPNIVRVHDFSQAGGLAAVSMEYVDGATLTQRRLEEPGRILSITALTPLAAQLCAALEYAHRTAKTAHRDLKPANILVTRGGEVKVTDFGISRSLTETRTRLTLPGHSGVTGTLPYMSPQQLRGDKPQATDDIYALGATLYELLAGKPPFHRGDLASLMLQIRDRSPLAIGAMRMEVGVAGDPVPAGWEATIMACLSKASDARPQSAADVAARLGLSGESARAISAAPQHGEGQKSRRAPLPRIKHALLAGVVAVVIVAGAILWRTTGADGVSTSRPAAPPLSANTIAQQGAKKEPAPAVQEVPALPVVAREFVVNVLPGGATARLWLGPLSDFAVPGDGRAVLANVPDGEHELAVQAAGYEPVTARVTVKEGRGLAEVRLVRVKGSLEITGRQGSRVVATNGAGEKTAIGIIGPTGVLNVVGILAIGDYAVRVEHEDCEPLEISRVELTVGRVTRLAPTQTPLPGELTVWSLPMGAEIRVDGVVVGRTPLVLPRMAAERSFQVEVALVGFHRAEQSVRLNPREKRDLDFGALEPETGGIGLSVSNALFPFAAVEVKVDGKPVTPKRGGEVWMVENVAAGTRVVEIAHRDYEPWKQTVDVRDHQNVSVTVTPVPKPAVLNLVVTGPKDFVVWVDRVRTKIVNNRIAVRAQNSVTVEIRAVGFRPVIGSIKLDANAYGALPITMEQQPLPKPGAVHENSLHMKFVPVPGLKVLLSIWETRVRDFELYLHATKQKSRLPAGRTVTEEAAGGVTWGEAKSFCQWLTEVERSEGNLAPTQRYRLPTDSEWSVAVGLGREGGKTPAEKSAKIRGVYPWGKQWPPPARSGNFAGEESGAIGPRLIGYNDGFNGVAPVGSFAANQFGIFDLGGNVWEWCEDENQPRSGRRVLRGGSFAEHTPDMLLSSTRANIPPNQANPNVGFRCVLETSEEK